MNDSKEQGPRLLLPGQAPKGVQTNMRLRKLEGQMQAAGQALGQLGLGQGALTEWLKALERLLVVKGVCVQEELDDMEQKAAAGAEPPPAAPEPEGDHAIGGPMRDCPV